MDRLSLQALLESILGSSNVYAQPPTGAAMKYPCILYQRDGSDTKFADDSPYSIVKRYQVTVISRSLDTSIADKVARLPMCTHSRFLVVDNLNQDIFTLYY